jgi:hypothetical protein
MWKQVHPELSPEVARVTTSVWDYEGYGQVGVMRSSFLAPPVLWFKLLQIKPALLKQAARLLTDLQLLISADLVYAEACLEETRSQRFLTFLGFVEMHEAYNRKLYSRSV